MRLEIRVEQVVRMCLLDTLDLLHQQSGMYNCLGHAMQLAETTGIAGPPRSLWTRMQQHVSQHRLLAPAGKGVVTDVGDAVAAEQSPAQSEHLSSDCLRLPRIDAMGNDVVEQSRSSTEVRQNGLHNLAVVQTQRFDALLTITGLSGGQLDTNELRIRQMCRHRDQVITAGATDLQYARSAGAWAGGSHTV